VSIFSTHKRFRKLTEFYYSFIDPMLEHDLASTKPWALSPLISTMPHFVHKRLRNDSADVEEPTFPPVESLEDSIEELHLTVIDEPQSSASSSGGTSPSSSSSSLASVSSTASKSGALSMTNWSPSRRKKRSITEKQTLQLRGASERRAFFSKEKNRKSVIFGPEVSVACFVSPPKFGF